VGQWEEVIFMRKGLPPSMLSSSECMYQSKFRTMFYYIVVFDDDIIVYVYSLCLRRQ
jgi:hypothetical protein